MPYDSFCSIFYNEVTTSRLCSGTSVASRNIRGGTVLHELTHAVSGTTDVGYGCSFDMSFSPSQAVRNADNYNVRSRTGFSCRSCSHTWASSASPPRCTRTLSAKQSVSYICLHAVGKITSYGQFVSVHSPPDIGKTDSPFFVLIHVVFDSTQ